MLDFLKGSKSGPRYTRLSPSTTTTQQWNTPLLRYILTTIIVLILCAFSFTAGKRSASPKEESIPLSSHAYTFKYNRIYGEKPNTTTDAAWASLFPESGGYLIHPSIAPTRSAIAVFHQLHCLDGLRTALWTFHDAAMSPEALDPASIPAHLAPPHMRHCIDLLRQSLMCRPDLAVEKLNEKLGGVTGFGTEHVCKNWEELVGFVREWQYYGLSEEEVELRKMRGGHKGPAHGGHNTEEMGGDGGHEGHGK